jgi:hypothetical protein
MILSVLIIKAAAIANGLMRKTNENILIQDREIKTPEH